ncbi:MAG: hypothetical protein GXP32_07120 [Kiritimatiellaeota bacterium]|nr:hypothetical protein [Kiritimatiellota bacterium]
MKLNLWENLVELCRGEPKVLASWLDDDWRAKLLLAVVFIVFGSGAYGMSIGLWRAPEQAIYVAVKFPLLILLTTLGNGFLNGMTAQLLGAKMSFVDSFKAVCLSFALASVILGALSPLSCFLVYNAPGIYSDQVQKAHVVIILSDVFVIAFAGGVANLRLFNLLKHLNNSGALAARILFSWLAGNLLLGGQLSWIMRPFIGTPSAPVEFIRNNPLDGNFFETVWHLCWNLFN